MSNNRLLSILPGAGVLGSLHISDWRARKRLQPEAMEAWREQAAHLNGHAEAFLAALSEAFPDQYALPAKFGMRLSLYQIAPPDVSEVIDALQTEEQREARRAAAARANQEPGSPGHLRPGRGVLRIRPPAHYPHPPTVEDIMSHFTTITTSFKDLEALEAAVNELGGVWKQDAIARTPFGHQKAPFVISFPNCGYDIAVRPSEDGIALTTDWYAGHVAKHVGENFGLLRQRYGLVKAERLARQRRQRTQRKHRDDGSITLVVTA